MVDDLSTMTESAADLEADPAAGIHSRIAQRVRDLRATRGLSLEALAQASGVSRSMISLVERAESSPTAVVLERLAMGLGVSLASLFDAPQPSASPVARRAGQPQWQDPHSGYVRRNVSPAGAASPLQIVEVQFPPKARVAYETGPREPAVHQQIWVLEGRIDVTVGSTLHKLETGDCLALVLDQPLSYFNPTKQVTRYAVILTSAAFTR
jgi:transcriptional regulator with XRE-family HTH domain